MAEENAVNWDEVIERIIAAFREPNGARRTAAGIARETSLPVDVVEDTLKKYPGMFRRSPISPARIPLYRLTENAESSPQDTHGIAR